MKILKRFLIGEVQNNCAIVNHNDKIILIDAPYPIDNITNYLKSNNLELDYIFITHIHFDHIAGVEHLVKLYPNVEVYTSKKEKYMFNDPKENLSYRHDINVNYTGEIKTFDKLEIKGIEFKYISGHSKQSTVICFDKAIFTGDTLFRETIGRSDLPHGNQEKLISGIKSELLGLDKNTKVYPGHGFATTIENELQNNSYLK